MTDQTTPTPPSGAPRPRSDHFVNKEPWDPYVSERLTADQEKYYMAGQWKLMWWRFRRHRPAVVSAIFLALVYFSTVISEFIAPYDLHTRHSAYIFAPPQQVHVMHEGQFIGPFVYALKTTRDMETLQRVYTPDTTKPQKLRFFCLGDSYEFWGLIEGSFHFVCPPRAATSSGWAPTGSAATCSAASSMPRASRSPSASSASRSPSRSPWSWAGSPATTAAGSTTSSSASPRSSRASRTCRLWLALSAALPVTWSPLLVYFGITIILALLDWPGLGRAVRSKLLSLARGGLRRRRPDDGRQARPHHRPPSAAGLHEPSHRLGHAFHSLDDPGRDGA